MCIQPFRTWIPGNKHERLTEARDGGGGAMTRDACDIWQAYMHVELLLTARRY